MIYFSLTGRTAKVAGLIERYIGCDTERIITVTPYPDDEVLVHRLVRGNGPLHRPKIRELNHDISRYGIVILGMPVWNNGIPAPMMSFIESVDWRGIKVHPFFTSGGLYVNAYSQLQQTCKGAGITDPLYIIFNSKGELAQIKEDQLG